MLVLEDDPTPEKAPKMDIEKVDRLLNSAGKNFFAFHIQDILSCWPELDVDPELKSLKIRQYYREQRGFRSKDEYGVRVRLNAILQILRAGMIRDALMLVNEKDPRMNPQAIVMVKKTLASLDRDHA